MIFLYKLVYDCFPFLDLRTKKTKCIFLFDKKKKKTHTFLLIGYKFYHKGS